MKRQELIDGITEYLTLGGLVNPGQMDHQKVRDLMMDVRYYLENTHDENDHEYSEEEYPDHEIIPINEWKEYVDFGTFIPDDGDGYYMINDEKTPVYVWEHPAPEGTTHVIWYNK